MCTRLPERLSLASAGRVRPALLMLALAALSAAVPARAVRAQTSGASSASAAAPAAKSAAPADTAKSAVKPVTKSAAKPAATAATAAKPAAHVTVTKATTTAPAVAPKPAPTAPAPAAKPAPTIRPATATPTTAVKPGAVASPTAVKPGAVASPTAIKPGLVAPAAPAKAGVAPSAALKPGAPLPLGANPTLKPGAPVPPLAAARPAMIGPPVPNSIASARVVSSTSTTITLPPTPTPLMSGSTVHVRPSVSVAHLEDRIAYQYNALGRRDPFKPLLDGQNVSFVGMDVGGDAPPDIGALHVVGVVWGSDDKFALAEDASGRSFVLRTGDKVMNGVVSGLKRDAMMVQLTVDGQTESVVIPLTRKGEN
jgi:hypothetical protein